MFAIFFSLSIFSAVPHASGGKWHSAGNAPLLPHRPHGPADFICKMTGYTTVGKKSYKFESERMVRDEEFREPNWASVTHTLMNTGDPGMDGQSFTLSFRKDLNGEEVMELNVALRAGGKATSYSRYSAPRSVKVISGVSDLSIVKPGAKAASWVRVVAECRELH